MKQHVILLLLVGISICGISPIIASAHIRLLPEEVIPRSSSDSLKTAPCGGVAKTAQPTILSPGASVTLNWEETIEHPGWFRIAFSPAADLGFDDHILLDRIPDRNSYITSRFYSATVTLPQTTCTDCTLQLIQVMTDRSPPTNYTCADI